MYADAEVFLNAEFGDGDGASDRKKKERRSGGKTEDEEEKKEVRGDGVQGERSATDQ